MAANAGRSLLLAAAILALAGCVRTAPFLDGEGRPLPQSVATMERMELGGVEQSVWVRGRDARRPLLVLLHGGPGASESALFRRFDAALEDDFVVVYWEQRGTGRSFDPSIPPSSMTIERMLLDLDELVDRLRVRFGQDRVVLLAHSWGTVLGTRYAYACPAKVRAYLGTGQIVNKREAQRRARGFALAEARRRGDARAVEALRAIDVEQPGVDQLFALSHWVERFGGAFRADLSTGGLILAALSTDEADVTDLVRFGRGNRFSHDHLLDEFVAVDLAALQHFEVPIFLLLGRHDKVTASELAADWFATLAAPHKELVWFDASAHHPPFEEPERFVAEVRRLAGPAPPLAASDRCTLSGARAAR